MEQSFNSDKILFSLPCMMRCDLYLFLYSYTIRCSINDANELFALLMKRASHSVIYHNRKLAQINKSELENTTNIKCLDSVTTHIIYSIFRFLHQWTTLVGRRDVIIVTDRNMNMYKIGSKMNANIWVSNMINLIIRSLSMGVWIHMTRIILINDQIRIT